MTDRMRAMFPGLVDPLAQAPDLFRETALDLEAGRISTEQARARMRALGFQIVAAVYADVTRPRPHNPGTLDPVVAWDAIPPAVQRLIGAASVAATVADLGVKIASDTGDGVASAPRYAAVIEALSLIADLVTIHVLDGEDMALPPRPDLRPLGIRQCRACGCTDDFACDGGCSWAEPDLCTACVPEAGG